MPNIFRKILADKLRANGGYFAQCHSRFPLTFTVALHHANLDFDNMVEQAKQHHAADFTGLDMDAMREDWNPDTAWEWAQEDMCSGLNDDDGRRSYSPATAVKYGLDYNAPYPLKFKRLTNEFAFFPAKRKGWIRVDPFIAEYFDVEFGLYGRCGKHLCVESFEGHELNNISSDDLADAIETGDPEAYSNRWCRNLCAMIEEWDEMFTSINASRELEYQAAYRLASDARDAQEERKAAEIESVERGYWNQRDVVTV
jgi:hypothetical protein